MAHSAPVSTDSSFSPDDSGGTKQIWRVFWILLIITVIELALGLSIYFFLEDQNLAKLLVRGLIIILSLAKAFYIVSSFMHLGSEIKNMIMTIVVPLLLFVWFIGAFLYEGNSWKNMRNTNAGADKYQPQYQKPADAVKPGSEK